MLPSSLGTWARRRLGVFATIFVLVASGAAFFAPNAWGAAATGGVGALLPYVELQAENAATNGTMIGPSATGVSYGTLQDEASNRKAVTLQGTGEYVTFTTTAPTNSIDVRYSIPDTASGSTYRAPLSLYINGSKQTDLTLTNAYSWFYGSYPFTNTPGANPHHFFDEVHRLFTATYPAGTAFTVQVDSEDTAPSYTIDFADFEQVGAPLTQPSGSVSVSNFGADTSGVNDATNAFNSAISAAGAGGTVWIPPGTYNIPGHIGVNDVTIAAAGMWYSIVKGATPGFYGNSAPNPSQNVHLQNFAIFGDVQDRNDSAQVNGVGGAMSNSSVANVWIEHTKVGAWMDGAFDKLTFSAMRIRDTTADGINFHGGVTNSTVTNSDIRNTGDDGLATWADASIGADAYDSLDHDTVQYPILANGIAIYGGHDNTVDSNRVIDAGLAQGGGIHVGQRFTSTPVGRTTISNNTMIRDGGFDPNWNFGVGSLWFDGSQGAITGPINVANALIQQAPYEAVQWVEGTISGVNLNNVTIQGAGTFALQEQTGGAATFTNVVATGVGAQPPVYDCEGSNFVVTDAGGNSGISPSQCGTWPTPVWPPYVGDTVNSVSVTPASLSFGSQVTGTASSAQTVTVTNSGSSSQSVSATISGQYADTTTCGTSLAANATCTYSVTFHPSTAGAQTGTLAVSAGGVANNVALTGSGVTPGPMLSADSTSLSFASTVVGSTTQTQKVTIRNTGTTSAAVSGVSTSTAEFTQTNNCTTIAVNESCTVNMAFKPVGAGSRTATLTVASNANNTPTTVRLTGTGTDSSTNIAAGKTATASTSNTNFVPGNATDADTSSYWESVSGSSPQWLQVDLGSSYNLSKLTLKLPPSTAWATRTQTIAAATSADGTNFTTNVGATGYTFDPTTGNTASINLPPNVTGRYVRLTFTANTGWAAGQLSDLAVFPGSGAGGGGAGSATLTATPTSLGFGSTNVGSATAAQSVTINNTGQTAAGVSGVSVNSGDYSQSNTCGTSIAAGGSCTVSVTFRPSASGTRTGILTVSSNATNPSFTVSLTGMGNAANTNLAAGKPTSEASHTQSYPSSNLTDGNQATYWESANGTWPAWAQVDLGSSQTVSRVALQLPAAWGARTQTLSVMGSPDGSTFTTLKSSATYTFDPASNNTVTITFTAASVRYLRINITANNVQNGGQLSELQVYS